MQLSYQLAPYASTWHLDDVSLVKSYIWCYFNQFNFCKLFISLNSPSAPTFGFLKMNMLWSTFGFFSPSSFNSFGNIFNAIVICEFSKYRIVEMNSMTKLHNKVSWIIFYLEMIEIIVFVSYSVHRFSFLYQQISLVI